MRSIAIQRLQTRALIRIFVLSRLCPSVPSQVCELAETLYTLIQTVREPAYHNHIEFRTLTTLCLYAFVASFPVTLFCLDKFAGHSDILTVSVSYSGYPPLESQSANLLS